MRTSLIVREETLKSWCKVHVILDIRNENGCDSLLICNIEMTGGVPLALNLRMLLTSHIIYETQYFFILLLLHFRNSEVLRIDFQLFEKESP